jgi:plasmid stabilization system protein ParE
MRFIVTVETPAEDDVDEIYAWLRKRSPLGAVRWYVSFLQALRELETRPERFAAASEARLLGHRVRELLFKTRYGRRYRLLFTVVEQEVRVLRVWGPGQRPARPRDLE